jgi:hypothetical protein
MVKKIGEKKTTVTKNGRKITMVRVAMKGFPQWRILSNVKARGK